MFSKVLGFFQRVGEFFQRFRIFFQSYPPSLNKPGKSSDNINGYFNPLISHKIIFLRDNLDWLSHATNWAKLIATLGVIHCGHEKESLSLMQSYLPKDTTGTSSGYAEGGGRRVPGAWPVCHGNAQGRRVRAAGKVLQGSLRTGDHHQKGEVQVSSGSLSFKSIQGKVYGYFVGVLLEIFFN